MDPRPQIDTPRLRVQRIACIRLVVADLAAASAFYRDALGFTVVEAAGASCVLALGDQTIGLTRPVAPGRPYPGPAAANDPWFQHFAIAVSDMAAAYARLSRYAQQPISTGGPQLLPPSTGSVTAYKFRDPDGHPLELSHIPGGAWEGRRGSGPFLGVDHTAVAVRDLGASVAFYTEVLGFALSGQVLNQGPEQDRLDGLEGVKLDIAVLTTPAPGPHVELLHYRQPAGRRPGPTSSPADIAATRMVLEAQGPAAGALLADPDGHLIEIGGTQDL